MRDSQSGLWGVFSSIIIRDIGFQVSGIRRSGANSFAQPSVECRMSVLPPPSSPRAWNKSWLPIQIVFFQIVIYRKICVCQLNNPVKIEAK
jgi:hypothetical protein